LAHALLIRLPEHEIFHLFSSYPPVKMGFSGGSPPKRLIKVGLISRFFLLSY
jgi:hypothetical protein